MNIKLVALVSFLSISMQGMKIGSFIKKNKNNPSILGHLLIDMGRWEKPNLKAAKILLKLGVSADATDRGDILNDNPGATALTTAASYGKTDYVQLLVENGADIEIKDPWDGRTPLMAASLYGYSDIVEFLLSKNANVNATNCRGNTALMWAASYAKVKIVEQLLEAKADIHIVNNNKESILDLINNSPFNQYKEEYAKIKELLNKAT
jgi:ankyrin repeat protein